MNKLKEHKAILITAVLLIIVLSITLFVIQSCSEKNQNQKQGQNQNSVNCSSFSYSDCPDSCVVCPPCEVCSSVSCQTEEFCRSIGFNRTWAKEVMK